MQFFLYLSDNIRKQEKLLKINKSHLKKNDYEKIVRAYLAALPYRL